MTPILYCGEAAAALAVVAAVAPLAATREELLLSKTFILVMLKKPHIESVP